MNAPINSLIRDGRIRYAGNKKLRIYGTLRCASGKRMKKENRVFFASEEEALLLGYRPCGNCMRLKYRAMHLNALAQSEQDPG